MPKQFKMKITIFVQKLSNLSPTTGNNKMCTTRKQKYKNNGDQNDQIIQKL
jgi:hypothetical protein